MSKKDPNIVPKIHFSSSVIDGSLRLSVFRIPITKKGKAKLHKKIDKLFSKLLFE